MSARPPVPKSTFTPEYQLLCRLLISARKDAGLTQIDVAARLRRPQSFVSNYERGERRLDVVEFLAVTRALGADPHAILREIEKAQRKKGAGNARKAR